MAYAEQTGEVPSQVAAVLPTGAGHTQAIVKSLEGSVSEIKGEIREIRTNSRTDFLYLIATFSAGFLILVGSLIAGYVRLDDKLDKLSQTGIRVDTKLEDLLQRIPAAVTPVPKR